MVVDSAIAISWGRRQVRIGPNREKRGPLRFNLSPIQRFDHTKRSDPWQRRLLLIGRVPLRAKYDPTRSYSTIS